MARRNEPVLLDCTLRDGGYVLGWDHPDEMVQDLITSSCESKIDLIEIGFVNRAVVGSSPQVGEWARLTQSTVDRVKEFLIDGLGGTRIGLAVMLDYGKAIPDDLLWLKDSGVALVRISCTLETLNRASAVGSYLKEKTGVGYSLNLMRVSTLNIEKTVEHLTPILFHSKPNVIYLADSFGACLPDFVYEFVKRLVVPYGTSIGFHAHNNLGLALANSLSALEAGAQYIDCSVCGVGRGGGNLPTESVVGILKGCQYLESSFRFSDKWLVGRNESLGLPRSALVTGLMNCHPNYADHHSGSDSELIRLLSGLSVEERQSYNHMGG